MFEFETIDLTKPLSQLQRAQGIYAIRNVSSGMLYVGSACFVPGEGRVERSIAIRVREHARDLDAGRHFNRYLQAAWKKHGRTSFEFLVIEKFTGSPESLLEREQFWIDALQAARPGRGYNILRQAGSRAGFRHSAETKERLRKLSTGRRHTAASKVKMRAWQLGRVQSQETKDKIGAAHRGKIVSAESRLKMSISGRGKSKPESHGKALMLAARTRKLCPQQVREIRAAHASGDSVGSIARRHGIVRQNVHAIVKRQTWRHL